jgi:predicted Na+-dependent transporter
MGPLFGAMEKNIAYFNTNFQTIDWITSYFYNFMMWLSVTIAFHKIHPHLAGSMPVRSVKVYSFFVVVFASISAIYMNHYSHSKDFYLYSILDAVLVFVLLGLANGYLYPLLFRQHRAEHA